MKTLGWFCAFGPLLGVIIFWVSLFVRMQFNGNFLNETTNSELIYISFFVATLFTWPVILLSLKNVKGMINHLLIGASCLIGFNYFERAILCWTAVLTEFFNSSLKRNEHETLFRSVPDYAIITLGALILIYGPLVFYYQINKD